MDYLNLPLPLYIERLAQDEPDRIIARILKKQGSDYKVEEITIVQLRNAIDEAAHWIDSRFGKDGNHGVLAFMAPPLDLRYIILMVAAIKTGRLAYLPSPRNNPEAHSSLLRKYKCEDLLVPKESPFRSLLKPVIEELNLTITEAPDLEDLLSASPGRYPWQAPSDVVDFRTEPMVGIHTSGSTGTPKPIVMPHGNFTAIVHWKRVPELGGKTIHYAEWKGKKALAGLPLFHAGGIDNFLSAMVYDMGLLYASAEIGPLNAEVVSHIARHIDVDFLFMSPATLADMAASPELIDVFSRVQGVTFGGGPLPQVAGDTIAKYCHVMNFIGTSEVGICPAYILDNKDWQYLHVSHVQGIEMRPHSDDLHEMVFVRDKKWEDFQVAFFTFPELNEYPTNDLFLQHPTNPDLWSWQGRTDDVIVFSNGEKFNPTTMENIINGSPHVKSALVYGSGKFQSALLVEPNIDEKDPATAEQIIDRIWPTVQKSNGSSVAHGRITTDMILITDPERPLPRAGKGTVQRKAAFKLYEKDLEELYTFTNGDYSSARKDFALEDGSPNVKALTQHILNSLAANSGKHLKPNDDFFSAGLDSLVVTSMIRSLRKVLGNEKPLTAKMIYEHPTALQLATHLCGSGVESETKRPEEVMQELYEKYSFDLPITARQALQIDPNEKTVVLTGSTGSFGSYLLDELIRDKTVAHIICLNRRENAEKIQRQSMEEKGLSTDLKDKTVTFAVANFSEQYLGLDPAMYQALLSSVTHIIHNAWHVNFNLPIQQFEKPHIGGVRSLVDFSARSAHGAMIFFVSSIGAVASYSPPSGTNSRSVPEEIISDWSAAGKESGYGQSKLVAENILAAAAREANIPCAVCRVGQIAGPTSGIGTWNKWEWLPSLVTSSKYLGCLPATLGAFDSVDWLPIDTAARTVAQFFDDAAEQTQKSPQHIQTYHCINPSKTTWDALLPAIQPYLGIHTVIPSHNWIELLAESEDKASDENPGAKLVTFYKGLMESKYLQIPLETTKSEKASEKLSRSGPITGDLMAKWLRKWINAHRLLPILRAPSIDAELVTIGEQVSSWDVKTKAKVSFKMVPEAI